MSGRNAMEHKLKMSLDDLIDSRESMRKSPRASRVNSPSRRQHPYEGDASRGRDRERRGRLQPRDVDEQPEFPTPENSIKVSSQADVRELAASVAAACRDGEPPALLTIGNSSINQAVKGIAIARNELQNDSMDLTFQPAFRHTDRTRPLIAFYLAKQRPSRYSEKGEDAELTVASSSKIIAVAGAIAGKVREGKRVSLTAIGVDAVTNAVLAIGNARIYLEDNNLDIKVQPSFTKLDKNGITLNAVRFAIIAEAT